MKQKEIEKLSLIDLELEIKKLYKSYTKNNNEDRKWKIIQYLEQRKEQINNDFIFTPEIVNHIERVNQILTDKTGMMVKKAAELDRQMQKVIVAGDDFLQDYEIEYSIKVEFNGEDLRHIEVDENQGQSDYLAIADILYFMEVSQLNSWNNFHSIKTDDETEKINWNYELCGFPKLKHINFCRASHLLFCHSCYSISDIIRIKNFWTEVNVSWQNFSEID